MKIKLKLPGSSSQPTGSQVTSQSNQAAQSVDRRTNDGSASFPKAAAPTALPASQPSASLGSYPAAPAPPQPLPRHPTPTARPSKRLKRKDSGAGDDDGDGLADDDELADDDGTNTLSGGRAARASSRSVGSRKRSRGVRALDSDDEGAAAGGSDEDVDDLLDEQELEKELEVSESSDDEVIPDDDDDDELDAEEAYLKRARAGGSRRRRAAAASFVNDGAAAPRAAAKRSAAAPKRSTAAKPPSGKPRAAAAASGAAAKSGGGGGGGKWGKKGRFGEEELDDEDFMDDFIDDEDLPIAERRVTGDHNFRSLVLKADHGNRPLWVCPDGRVFLETYSPIYRQAYDFLIAIAEPVCRPESVHEYILTPHSLYAAVSVGLETETIISVLNRLSKTDLPPDVRDFIRGSTQNYGKVKLVLKRNRFFVESTDRKLLKRLLADATISAAAISKGGEVLQRSAALVEHGARDIVRQVDEAGQEEQQQQQQQQQQQAAGSKPGAALKELEEDSDREVWAFEVCAELVEKVKQRCLPNGLNYPMLEEYDFRNDTHNPDLHVELKPSVQLRPYQEKSLNKMFGNGRGRSGIIVLPCGAGKSLVGVAAAVRMRKSCLCLCTSSVSVDQWRHQFRMWTNLSEKQVGRFTASHKEPFESDAGVLISTFNMVAHQGQRSETAKAFMEEISGREWGLLLLDEVHVVPAAMFRKVISIVKAHCKLGLTATLVREDELIGDLNFLIGPKLYEANWLDLTKAGHIANVQCCEVWCPMTREFMAKYLDPEHKDRQQLLYCCNPSKAMACEYLIRTHEARGDKVIVFSDNIFALRTFATAMRKPLIYGETTHGERTQVLHAFKTNPNVNTIFLSKVGDNSLDIPEATVLIQISSHAGSRRQEAQRLGRILRAKRGMNPLEFNAFFYTLVSTDTTEMYFSTKRQQFLVDQGYSYHVVTNLLEAGGTEGLHYSRQEDQLNLLTQILSMSSDESRLQAEVDQRDADTLTKAARPAVRRRQGSMADLSGGRGMTYVETQRAAGPRRSELNQRNKKLLSKLT